MLGGIVQARALAMASMDSRECAQLMTLFSEDELAAILACLHNQRRQEVMADLTSIDAHLAECAYDTMR